MNSLKRIISILPFVFIYPSITLANNVKWNDIPGGKVVNGEYQLKCGEGSGWQKCGEEEFECKLDKHNHIQTQSWCSSDGQGHSYTYLILDGVRLQPVLNNGKKKNLISVPYLESCWDYKNGHTGMHGQEYVASNNMNGPVYWVDLESKNAYIQRGNAAVRVNVETSNKKGIRYYYHKVDLSDSFQLDLSLVYKDMKTLFLPVCRKN